MDGSTAGGCTIRGGSGRRTRTSLPVAPAGPGTYPRTSGRGTGGPLDGDPEDLHRFRASLRRAWSLMAVGSDVLPSEELGPAAALASWFANVTFVVRDLDVLLRRPGRPRVVVVPELHDAPRRAPSVAVAAARADAFDTLVAELDGDRYPVLLGRWQAMTAVVRVGGRSGPDARRPMGEVSKLIWSSYRRFAPPGPAGHVHRRPRRLARPAQRRSSGSATWSLRSPHGPADSAFEGATSTADLQGHPGSAADHRTSRRRGSRRSASAGGRAALAAGVVTPTRCTSARTGPRPLPGGVGGIRPPEAEAPSRVLLTADPRPGRGRTPGAPR